MPLLTEGPPYYACVWQTFVSVLMSKLDHLEPTKAMTSTGRTGRMSLSLSNGVEHCQKRVTGQNE